MNFNVNILRRGIENISLKHPQELILDPPQHRYENFKVQNFRGYKEETIQNICSFNVIKYIVKIMCNLKIFVLLFYIILPAIRRKSVTC